MTRRHLRRRSSRRISALGLALSLGLIFGASGIIGVNAAQPASLCGETDEIVKASVHRAEAAESTALPQAVLEKGHPREHHNL